MKTIKIATWNLERPLSRESVRVRRIRTAIENVGADIWILTETRATMAPVDNYGSVHSQPYPDLRPDLDERWVSVWSRWPATSVRTDAWSATAQVNSPYGELLVHGVVLPYMNEPGPARQRVPGWSMFLEQLIHQRIRWMDLRSNYPTTPLIVAGDLNQSLDGSRWYGSSRTRLALRQALDDAGLTCLTGEDVVAGHKLRVNHLVDHICASDTLAVTGEIECWEPRTVDGRPMSDHPGVAVRLISANSGAPSKSW